MGACRDGAFVLGLDWLKRSLAVVGVVKGAVVVVVAEALVSGWWCC